MRITIVHWGNIGKMEKKMETTIMVYTVGGGILEPRMAQDSSSGPCTVGWGPYPRVHSHRSLYEL